MNNTVTLDKDKYDALMDMKRDLERDGVHFASDSKCYVTTAPGVRDLFTSLLDDFEAEVYAQNEILDKDKEKHLKQVAKDKERIKVLEKNSKNRIKEFEKNSKSDIDEYSKELFKALEPVSDGLFPPLKRIEFMINHNKSLLSNIKSAENALNAYQTMSLWQRLKFFFTGKLSYDTCGPNEACNKC